MTFGRASVLWFGAMPLWVVLQYLASPVHCLSAIKSRAFLSSPRIDNVHKLILIGGCSGTGKSTFGMSVALDQGILKCISTDTLRSVMRSFIDQEISPALHRSSYDSANEEGTDDPVKSWLETCNVLRHSVRELVDEMIDRRVSLVVEGVHLIPSDDLIKRWEASGGVAVGIMLQVSDEEAHKSLLLRRGAATGKGEEAKLTKFNRVRAIHDEMIRLAKKANWLVVEQNLQPDPLEIVASYLWQGEGIQCYSAEQLTSKAERRSGSIWAQTVNADDTCLPPQDGDDTVFATVNNGSDQSQNVKSPEKEKNVAM